MCNKSIHVSIVIIKDMQLSTLTSPCGVLESSNGTLYLESIPSEDGLYM